MEASGRRPWKWDSVGPGLVFFLAVTGPDAFLSNAAAGASYGYAMIWALALALLFRYTLVSASARYVLVTGESLLQGYGRIGKWLVWTALAATILVRHSTNFDGTLSQRLVYQPGHGPDGAGFALPHRPQRSGLVAEAALRRTSSIPLLPSDLIS